MNIVYTCIYQHMCCIYQYILVYTSYPVTGFRGGHRDAAMLDASQGSETVPPDQYEVETIALADRNLNVPEMFVKSVYTVLSCVKHVI